MKQSEQRNKRSAASTEQICHIVRNRTLRFGWKERDRWKEKGFKYYSISSEELDELERRAGA